MRAGLCFARASLLLAALPLAAPASDLAEALLDGDAVRAAAALDAIGRERMEDLATFGAPLLAARVAALSGDAEEAMEAWEELALASSPWQDVALHALAQAAREAGDAAREAGALARLLDLPGSHPARDVWALRLAELRAQAGKTAEARALLGPLATSARERRSRREAQAWLIRMDVEAGDAGYALALPRYEALLEDGQEDDAALMATQAVTIHEARRRVDAGHVGHRVRGLVFYKNRIWDEALAHLGRAASIEGVTAAGFRASPVNPEPPERGKKRSRRRAKPKGKVATPTGELSRAEMVFFIGRTYYRKGDYASAAAAFELAGRISTSPSLSHSAAYQRIVCLSRADRLPEALVELDRLEARNPGAEMVRQITLRRLILLRLLRRNEEARLLCQKVRATTRDPRYVEDLLWHELAASREAAASEVPGLLERLEALGGDDRARARLLRADDLRRAGDVAGYRALLARVVAEEPRSVWGELARRQLLEIDEEPPAIWDEALASTRALLAAAPAGDTDPAALARERLLELRRSAPRAFARDGLPLLRDAYRRSPRHAPFVDLPALDVSELGPSSPRCLRLLSLGLAQEAAFALLQDPDPGLPPLARAAILALGGEWGRALAIAEMQATRIPSDMVTDAVAPALRMLLYPLPPWLAPIAKLQDVDPLLLAAISREESRYDARARSAAGARGLMQLVEDTAIALHGAPLRTSDLYRLQTSAGLGARYVKELLAEMGGSEACAIVAYNAGPDAAREWCRLGGPGMVSLEAEVSFVETRGYLGKVTLSHLRYLDLYRGSDPPTWRTLVRVP